MLENAYYDQLTGEYNAKIAKKKAELMNRKWGYPRTSNFLEAAFFISPVVGLIFAIRKIGNSSNTGNFLIGVFGVCAVILGFYGLMCAAIYAHNKSIDRKCKKIERALLAKKEERLKKYREDIQEECQILITEYNRSTKTSKVYDWMDELWNRAICDAAGAEYLTEITPTLSYTVLEDRIMAEINYGGDEQHTHRDEFVFRKRNVTPVVQSGDAYRGLVERAGYAMFLYKKYRFDLLGTKEKPGIFAYAPGQTVRDNSTRASITVDNGRYPFAAESYLLRYRAANPKHHPPEVLTWRKEGGR